MEQIDDARKDRGGKIIKDKNKEFLLIESMCYIKLLDVYFKSLSNEEKQECIYTIRMLLHN
jgi:hypothetical protein